MKGCPRLGEVINNYECGNVDKVGEFSLPTAQLRLFQKPDQQFSDLHILRQFQILRCIEYVVVMRRATKRIDEEAFYAFFEEPIVV